MDQHSQEWWTARCGKITASRIGDLMARNQPRKGKTVGEWSARRNNYLKEKVAERITGKNRDRRQVASLSHRLDLEPDARAAYEFYYLPPDSRIEMVGFIDHPRIPFAGCSPDGMITPKGGIEIKCCDAEMHLEIVSAEAIDPDYIFQCHFNMACTDADWWDFVAFSPEMPEELKVFVKRIERDESVIQSIEQHVIEFNEEVEQRVKHIVAISKGSTVLEATLADSLATLTVH